MADHPLRQVIRLDLVRDRQLLELRHETPVSANDTPDEPFVSEVVEALVLAVALACGVHKGEVARLADRLQVLLVGGQIQLLQCDGYFLGESDADEPSA